MTMLVVWCEIDAIDRASGDVVTVRATSHNDAASTAPGGLSWIPAILRRPGFTLSLFDGAFSGRLAPGAGEMDLAWDALSHLPPLYWSHRPCRMWAGTPGTDVTTIAPLFAGVVETAAVRDGRLTLRLAVDDGWLDRPLLGQAYAGTGGAEGPADLKGQPKPLAVGAPRGVEPVLVDAARSIFQFDAYGLVAGVAAAFERAAAFPAAVADYSDYDALAAALDAGDVPPGFYATASGVGLVGFGAPPSGVVTLDLVAKPGIRMPGEVIRELALAVGASAAQIDDASLANLDTELAALDATASFTVSHYQRTQVAARAVIQEIAQSCNAAAGVGWHGRLVTPRVRVGAPTTTLAADGTARPAVTRVEQLEVGPPFWRLALGSERNYRVHRLDEIAFAVDLADRGDFDAATTYREGEIVRGPDGRRYLYTNPTPTGGNAPPDASFWQLFEAAPRYSDGTAMEALKPAEAGADTTGSHISAGVAGQGSGATANNLTELNASEGSKLAGIESGADATAPRLGSAKLLNGSFEAGAEGWTLDNATISTSQKHSGTQSLRIVERVSNDPNVLSDPIPAKQGQRFKVVGWALRDEAFLPAGSFNINIREYDANGMQLFIGSTGATASKSVSGWQALEGTYTVQNAATDRIRVDLAGSAHSNTGAWFVDDVNKIDLPKDLTEVNPTEGSKLAGIESGATVGAKTGPTGNLKDESDVLITSQEIRNARIVLNLDGTLAYNDANNSPINLGSLDALQLPNGPAEAGADKTINNKAKSLDVPDTRSDNQPPTFYTAKGRGIYPEFKFRSVILGSLGTGTYGWLTTEVKWINTTGGRVTQTFVDDAGVTWRRRSSSDNLTWEAWNKVYAENAKPNIDNDVLDGAAYRRPTIAEADGGGRAYQALDGSARLVDARRVRGVQAAGLGAAFSARPIAGWTDTGGAARIDLVATTLQVGGAQIAYPAGSVGGLAYNTTYHIYRDDAALAGGGTYLATTSLQAATAGEDRVYFGAYTTGSAGGAGGGSSPPPDQCIAADQWLPGGLRGWHLRPGHELMVLTEDLSGIGTARVESAEEALAECVEIVTETGVRLVCSTTTPLTLRDGSVIRVREATTETEVPVAAWTEDTWHLDWERIERLRPVGPRKVIRVHAGGRTFAAAADCGGPYVLTHNAVKV